MPLDFVYNREMASYDLNAYVSDAELLAKVQTGKGDPLLFEGNLFLYIEGIFAETIPTPVEQQLEFNPSNPARSVGTNDL